MDGGKSTRGPRKRAAPSQKFGQRDVPPLLVAAEVVPTYAFS